MDVKIEIKEEPWYEDETTELSQEKEIFEFAPVLNVNKKEAVCEVNGEELSSLESPRLTTEAIYHDGNDIYTSLTHCEIDDFTSDFKTTSECAVLVKNQNKESPVFNCTPICEYEPVVCNEGKPQENCEASKKNSIDSSETNLCGCDVCERTFKQKSHLSSDILIHSDTKGHTCNTCKKSFKQKSDLKRHSFCHSDVRPYKCESCEKSFSCSSDLKKHTLGHLGVKPYKCESCDKCFRRKSYLTRHTLCHTGTKPYKCGICDRSFNDKSNLVRHTMSHSGIKPYKCDKCERSFNTNPDLKQHVLCHTGIKPYKCDACEKHFKRKSHLIRHALAHSHIKNITFNPVSSLSHVSHVDCREQETYHPSSV